MPLADSSFLLVKKSREARDLLHQILGFPLEQAPRLRHDVGAVSPINE